MARGERMKIEYIVYLYLAVCLSMIFFNIATVFGLRLQEALEARLRRRFLHEIRREIEQTRRRGESSRPHRQTLFRRLRHSEMLLIYMDAAKTLWEEDATGLRLYMRSLSEVFSRLDPCYERRNDPIRRSFFLYTLTEYSTFCGTTYPRLAEAMLRAVRSPNIYCRENALAALCATGMPQYVVEGLQILDSERIRHSGKLITDGLLRFAGDRAALSDCLWAAYDGFSLRMKEAVLNFMRFDSGRHGERLLSILCDEGENPELRYSAIRYFGRYPDPRARPVLLRLAAASDTLPWEYVSIASGALAAYPGDETVRVLKKNLRVANWYVRSNAAESLERLGVEYGELIDILNGNDRFAREILAYQLDLRRNRINSRASLRAHGGGQAAGQNDTLANRTG